MTLPQPKTTRLAEQARGPNSCCKVENMSVATGDGRPDCRVVCLTCKTCHLDYPYMLDTEDEWNVCYAFAKCAVDLHEWKARDAERPEDT